MKDLIDRQEAIRAFDDAGFCTHGYIVDVLKGLPSAQPIYTDEEIQKMQDLESAEIEKAYQIGYEEGKKDAQQERPKGKWNVTDAYPHNVYCSECHKRFAQTHWAVWEDGSLPRNFCPNCGADMRGEQNDEQRSN
jgi:hypothetical protein